MPIIEAHILEGYTDDEKARLASALGDAALTVVPAAPDAVTVMLHEMPKSHYMRGGQHRDPAPARADATAIVRAYLSAMEARDLDTAQSMLGDGFVMNFPDAPGMTTPDELIAWAKPRYAFVKKTYETVEAFQKGETAIVYAIGTLHGEWLDGSTFKGIRFIDRFELVDGKITRQDVWNDMAEVKANT
jgi:4-oxalocrotonate tautomerase family enzyme